MRSKVNRMKEIETKLRVGFQKSSRKKETNQQKKKIFNAIQSSSVVRVVRLARRRSNIRHFEHEFLLKLSCVTVFVHFTFVFGIRCSQSSFAVCVCVRVFARTIVAGVTIHCVLPIAIENVAAALLLLLLLWIGLYHRKRVCGFYKVILVSAIAAFSLLVFMSKNKSQTFYRKINRIYNFNYFGWLNRFATKMFISMIRIIARIERRRSRRWRFIRLRTQNKPSNGSFEHTIF